MGSGRKLARYWMALAALVAALAVAAALLPTDAPPGLLAAGVVVQTLAVDLAPANKPAASSPARRRDPTGGYPG